MKACNIRKDIVVIDELIGYYADGGVNGTPTPFSHSNFRLFVHQPCSPAFVVIDR